MDPLTALGLSANVAQFVSFVSELLSKSKEIYTSTKGCTNKVLSLETVYAQLRDLSSSLELSSQKDPKLEAVKEKSNFVEHVFSVNGLSQSCKMDCDRLLDVLRELRVGDGSKKRWQSFTIALKTVWKRNEIADLEQRLHYVQATLTLHICTLTRYMSRASTIFIKEADSTLSYWHDVFQHQLENMRQDNESLNSQQSTRLDDITRLICDLGTRIEFAGPEPLAKTFKPADIESLQSQMSQLSMAKADVAKEHIILRSLSFESRPIRYSSIPEAHHQTFGWVFKESCDQHEESSTGNLLGWLRKEDGFFWVSGKPGSGKSTLMKFVTDQPQTLRALSIWSYPKPAVIARHFFWSAGTPMQKSWQGLLQTLLYGIFRQLPDLIESTCTERWPKTIKQLNHDEWHLPELRKILQRIANQEKLTAKFCFFIDGLDEFEGDYLEFCDVLQTLSRSPHIKLCVSSRPWNVFEDFFGRDVSSKLYMNRLTRKDIRSYAEDRHQEHPRWKELMIEIRNAEWLVDQITERAAGVFLWVFLVTRLLRNGLTEYDSFSDMRRRLENIPTDLEMFFKQILESVEPFYHEKMATTLQIALAAGQPAPIAIYKFHDEEYEDKNNALKLPLQPMDAKQVTLTQAQITRRLNGRCRGLLEVNTHHVEFLHRSVMDFLRTPEMSNYLDRKAPTRFNAKLSLLRAFTAYIKSTKFTEFVDRTDFARYTTSRLMSALLEALTFAKQLEENFTVYKLLDELAYCIPQMHKTNQARLNVWGNSSNPVSLFFWEPVINVSLVGYLHQVLLRLPDYFPEFKASAESFMIFSMVISLTTTLKPHRQMDFLRYLLKVGSHPNETYCDSYSIAVPYHMMQLAWKEMLLKIMPLNLTLVTPGSLSNKSLDVAAWKLKWTLHSGLFALILKRGGNPNAIILEQPTSYSTPVWINFVYLSFCIPVKSSYEALYLQALDCFIAAGADIRISVCSPRFSGSRLQNRTALDLFLHHLSQTSVYNDKQINHCLLSKVSERLLIMTKIIGAERDNCWPILENIFPPQVISHLKRRLLRIRPEMRYCSSDASTQMQKRILPDNQDNGLSRKRFRPYDILAADPL
ncbi:MAG: hypothetical protein Q9187_007003 [Circinaria calcarea]